MCQTNTGEPIALRKRGMSVDGLSTLDTSNLAAPDHWYREACLQPSALHGTCGLRGPRPFARERPFSGVELCDLNFHCGSASDSREGDLTAEQPTPALRGQTAEFRGWHWTAIMKRSQL